MGVCWDYALDEITKSAYMTDKDKIRTIAIILSDVIAILINTSDYGILPYKNGLMELRQELLKMGDKNK